MSADELPPDSCPWCGSDAPVAGTTCPKSITCRRCGAQPGHSCKRPSGHKAMSLHATRVGDAERLDALRAAESEATR